MKFYRLIFVFIGFLLLSLLITLPASLVLHQLKLDKEISYGSVNGVWWNFDVDWLRYKNIQQDNVRVQLDFSCLIFAKACVQVNNESVNVSIDYSFITQDLNLLNSKIKVDFLYLNTLLNGLIIKPTGSIELNINTLTFNDNQLKSLRADIFWHKVGVQGESFNLGTLGAQITHEQGLIRGDLFDQSDKLNLSDYLKIEAPDMLYTDIQLKTLTTFPTMLKTLLQNVLAKTGVNQFQYKINSHTLNLGVNPVSF